MDSEVRERCAPQSPGRVALALTAERPLCEQPQPPPQAAITFVDDLGAPGEAEMEEAGGDAGGARGDECEGRPATPDNRGRGEQEERSDEQEAGEEEEETEVGAFFLEASQGSLSSVEEEGLSDGWQLSEDESPLQVDFAVPLMSTGCRAHALSLPSLLLPRSSLWCPFVFCCGFHVTRPCR